jgi:hypothetical protein
VLREVHAIDTVAKYQSVKLSTNLVDGELFSSAQ